MFRIDDKIRVMNDKSKPFVVPPEQKPAVDEAIQKIISVNPFAPERPAEEQAVSTGDKEKKSRKNESNNLAAPPDLTKLLEEGVMKDLDAFMEALEEMGISIEELQELIARDPEMKSLKIGKENRKRLLRLLQSMIEMYNNLEKCDEKYKEGKPQEENDIKVLHQNLTEAVANIEALQEGAKQDNALEKLLNGSEKSNDDMELLSTAVGAGGALDEMINVAEKVVDVEQELLKHQGLER